MAPTYDTASTFEDDWNKLTPDQRERLRTAVTRLVADLRTGTIRPGLRIKRVQGTDDVWEMTYAPDGRATFTHGPEHRPGHAHIQWRRIGTHDVLNRP